MAVSISKPAHQAYASNPASMNVHRGFDGSVQGMTAKPSPAQPTAAQPRLEQLKAKVLASWSGGPALTPEELDEYTRLSGVAFTTSERAAAPGAAPPAESPYDPMVVTSRSGPVTSSRYLGMRHEVDANRRRMESSAQAAELAVQKGQLELEQAQAQAEYQRWMVEQMKRNPYGMGIRDLIYGKGG